MHRQNHQNQHHNPLPWMPSSSSNESQQQQHSGMVASADVLQRFAPKNLSSRNATSSIAELDDDVAIHLENPAFVDTNSVFDHHHENDRDVDDDENQYLTHIKNNKSYKMNTNNLTSFKDPSGLTSYGNKIVISNTINKKLYIVIGFVLIFLILELTVMRHRSFKGSSHHQQQHSSPTETPHHDVVNQENQQQLISSKLRHFIPENIDFSSELFSVFWSTIVIITLASLIQTYELSYNMMTGDCIWCHYRSFILVSKRKFTITSVRRVVGKIQVSPNNSKKKASSSSSSSSSTALNSFTENAFLNKQKFSIELVVVAIKDPLGFPPQDLVVQEVTGHTEAQEALKTWVGFFQRMGGNCEAGNVSKSVDENKHGFV